MLTVIRAYVALLIDNIRDRFTPDTAGLIASLRKLEAKIERSINKSYRNLANMKAARDRLDRQMVDTNASLDGALKLLHKVSDLSN